MGSDLNAADKMPMYEILGFRGRVLGLERAIFVLELWEFYFVIGVLSQDQLRHTHLWLGF